MKYTKYEHLQDILQKLYEDEITDDEARALMDSDEAKDTLITLLNRGLVSSWGIED